jgi:predicted dehydrogenase
MAVSLAWVGLGAIARHHYAALRHMKDPPTALAGVDPEPRARAAWADRLSVYPSLESMFDSHAPDVVVVSSPTRTHFEVCHELMKLGGSTAIIVEKPIATNVTDLLRLMAATETTGVRLGGIYHAAHAPEVEWGLRTIRDHNIKPCVIEAEFADPYLMLDPNHRIEIYGDSWLDSGINSLSILNRYVALHEGRVEEIPDLVSTFFGVFAASTDETTAMARILTTWHAVEPSKSTRLRFQDGRQLILNHQSMTAQLFAGERLISAWGYSGGLERLTAHYVGALGAALAFSGSPDIDKRLHSLLLSAAGYAR